MSGRCPVCDAAINHEAETLTAARLYRCDGCRLEFVIDAKTGKLVRARFEQGHSAESGYSERE
jgi:hypothetical protein